MNLIAFGFTAQAGKDYSFKLLQRTYWDRPVIRFAFGDAVKEGLRPVLEGSGIDPFTEDPVQKAIIRPLLVAHGEFWRAVDVDHWCSQLMARLDRQGPATETLDPINVVVDCRYPNECQAVRARGGAIVELQTTIPPANATEAANSILCSPMATHKLVNDRTSNFDPLLLALARELFGDPPTPPPLAA
jgi:hypothetical protein